MPPRTTSLAWTARQARALADPAGLVALRVMLEREPDKRLRRLRAAAVDSLRERRRPSRSRMRSLVLLPGGRLQWRSVPAPPRPGPDGAVVRPIAIATCDMDRPIGLGATPFVAPLHFGHECVAEVLAVGSDVASVRAGDRVVVPFQISCGACGPCLAGRTANCLAVPPISMYGFGVSGGHWGGAIADELAVPFADGMLVHLPPGVEPASAASVADNVTDAYRHIGPHLPGLLAEDPDASVIIVAGMSRRHLFTASVALYAGQIARTLGAPRVALVDARPAVRIHAESLGLLAVDPRSVRELAPARLVADVSATPAGTRLALTLTAPDGVCSSSGTLHASTRIPSTLMFGRNMTLTIARAHARSLIPEVLDLITARELRPERVTTVRASIDDAQQALSEHLRGASTKTVLSA
jgi:alcohol dehydrogenase